MIRWTGLAPWEFEFPFPVQDFWAEDDGDAELERIVKTRSKFVAQ